MKEKIYHILKSKMKDEKAKEVNSILHERRCLEMFSNLDENYIELGFVRNSKWSRNYIYRELDLNFLVDKYYGKKEVYCSLFTSIHKPDWNLLLSDFVLDFDCKENIEKAKKDALTFIWLFEEVFSIPKSAWKIYFSGNKGFHLILPRELLDIKPHKDLPKALKRFVSGIKNDLQLETLDLQIYNKRRMFRLENTLNIKSNLYKIPLTYSELQCLRINEIKELAKKPRKINYSLPKIDNIETLRKNFSKLIELLLISSKEKQSKKKVTHIKGKRKKNNSKSYSPDICPFFRNLLQEFDWNHETRLAIASLLIKKNWSFSKIHNIFNSQCSNYNYKTTDYHLKWIQANNYLPPNCNKLDCPYSCGCKNPINFSKEKLLENISSYAEFIKEKILNKKKNEEKIHMSLKKTEEEKEIKEGINFIMHYRNKFKKWFPIEEEEDMSYSYYCVNNKGRLTNIDLWNKANEDYKNILENANSLGYKHCRIYTIEKSLKGKVRTNLKEANIKATRLYQTIKKYSPALMLREPDSSSLTCRWYIFQFFKNENDIPKEYTKKEEYSSSEIILNFKESKNPLLEKIRRGFFRYVDWLVVYAYWVHNWRFIVCSKMLKPFKKKEQDESPKHKHKNKKAKLFTEEEFAKHLEEKFNIPEEIGRNLFYSREFKIIKKNNKWIVSKSRW